jgi:alpha-glucosidase
MQRVEQAEGGPRGQGLRGLMALALLQVPICGAAVAARAGDLSVESPDKQIRLAVFEQAGSLRFRVSLDGQPAIEPSALGILVDGLDLGKGTRIGRVERYKLNETYPWRGVHSEAVNKCNGARVVATHAASRTSFTVDVRVFDDAVAFRFEVPGSGRRVPDAAAAFRIPQGSVVWTQGIRDHYEGLYSRRGLEEVPGEDWVSPPLTFRLPRGYGFGAITEAALAGYSGMVLQADGQGGFRERLGHAPPACYPFTLRYGDEEAKRLSVPAATFGAITTPWRVVLLGRDLNALVNSDAIPSLCPPPDTRLFPQGIRTPWVRPGRAVWRYLDGRDNSFEGIEEFSRLAGELGFEHQIVEGLWRKWSDSQLRSLVESSRERKVGIWVWLHSRDLRRPEERARLFESLHEAGVVGIKVDFLDHEAKEVIEVYQAILRDAAESQLMVDFHGANKPTGEARTWPNEMTREGIRGLEYGKTPGWAAHNATVPFTRFLAGHADYTPMVFGDRRKETTWAHQLATPVVFTSPVMVYAAHPASILTNPAAELIKDLPSVWDQTIVLPVSSIGEVAAFARRSGERWFLGVVNGPAARTVRLDLSFLGRSSFRALMVRDKGEDPAAVELETRGVTGKDSIELPLRAGGGFVARFLR